MGLFGTNSKKTINTSVYQIGKTFDELDKIPQQSWATSEQALHLITILKSEAEKMSQLLAPNGRTDWALVNGTQVDTYNEGKMPLTLFLARFNNRTLHYGHFGVESVRIWY